MNLLLKILILSSLILSAGCVAQRWNDDYVSKEGVEHQRAFMELDFYGPLGKRQVKHLQARGTGTTSSVTIDGQEMDSTLSPAELGAMIGNLLTGRPAAQPATRP